MATQSSTMEVSTDTDKYSSSNPLSSTTTTIVLMALVIVFGLTSVILSVALVTVCLTLRNKSLQSAAESIENVYDDIKVKDSGAFAMKSNKAYGKPIQTKQQENTYINLETLRDTAGIHQVVPCLNEQ